MPVISGQTDRITDYFNGSKFKFLCEWFELANSSMLDMTSAYTINERDYLEMKLRGEDIVHSVSVHVYHKKIPYTKCDIIDIHRDTPT